MYEMKILLCCAELSGFESTPVMSFNRECAQLGALALLIFG